MINSQPPMVDVLVSNTKTGAQYYLGKTPIKTSISKISEELGEVDTNGMFFLYTFKKEQFQTKAIYFPVSRWQSLETVLNLQLDPQIQEKEIDKNANAREMIQYLLNAEQLLHQGVLDRARFEVERALKLDPHFSWSFILKGNIDFLDKKFQQSLESYERAIELDPKSPQALKMIPLVRQKIEGGDSK